METRKFFEYDELKWFLEAYKTQIKIVKETTLKTCYKIKFIWL